MLSKAKFYGEAFKLDSGPLRYGAPRVVDVSDYVPDAGPVLFQDTFTAPDGTNLTTRGWTALSGMWTITGNKATKSAGSGQDVAYHACGADGVFSCDEVLLGGDNDAGIVWNVGGGKYWLCILQATNSKIFYFDGSAFNIESPDVAHSAAGSYAVEVTVNNDNIKVKVNGVLVQNVTVTSRPNKTATGAGIRINLTSAGTTFDNFTYRALPGLTLPARARNGVPIPTGGPYYLLRNAGSGTLPLYRDDGVLLCNLPPATATTVLLGTTRWWAFQDAAGTAKSVADTGSLVRTVPVGYVPPATPFTAPTSYDPILCTGGFYRARFCSNGSKADIWMAEGDVTPHLVDGVAVFRFNEVCYYFKASDPRTLGHGFTLTEDQVQWFDTCDLCTAGGGGTDTNPVPCTPPAGLATTYNVAWHQKVRMDYGSSGGMACAPSCEGDYNTNVTGSGTTWNNTAPVPLCTVGGTFTPELPNVSVYHQTLGDGTCCWEAFFGEGVAGCRSVFRKYTGTTPVGTYAQADPPPWSCGTDGDTHQVCQLTSVDAISAVEVS
jgi:hypothetical protein